MNLVMFSKHLQELSIEDAGKAAKGIGFDGLDLTVRPNGHITPDVVADALPRAVDALDKLGVAVPMITTALTDRDDAAEATFKAAQKCGIRYAKLGYWRYRQFGHLRTLVEEAKAGLKRLEPLLLETGVTGCLHIHSGDDLTGSAHVVADALEGTDPNALGAFLDPGHMTLEGGKSGWKIGMDALADRTRLVALKDFGWFRNETANGVTWTDKLVPLNEGIVRWGEVFDILKLMRFDGTISFHSEYQGGHSWRDLTTQEVIAQTRLDFAYMQPFLNKLR